MWEQSRIKQGRKKSEMATSENGAGWSHFSVNEASSVGDSEYRKVLGLAPERKAEKQQFAEQCNSQS